LCPFFQIFIFSNLFISIKLGFRLPVRRIARCLFVNLTKTLFLTISRLAITFGFSVLSSLFGRLFFVNTVFIWVFFKVIFFEVLTIGILGLEKEASFLGVICNRILF
jgi:hypothetical protein